MTNTQLYLQIGLKNFLYVEFKELIKNLSKPGDKSISDEVQATFKNLIALNADKVIDTAIYSGLTYFNEMYKGAIYSYIEFLGKNFHEYFDTLYEPVLLTVEMYLKGDLQNQRQIVINIITTYVFNYIWDKSIDYFQGDKLNLNMDLNMNDYNKKKKKKEKNNNNNNKTRKRAEQKDIKL